MTQQATVKAFAAIAEPARRAIVDALADGERSVGELARQLKMRQPQTTKHLQVLRDAGIVTVRAEGTRRLHRVNGAGLKPIHDWVASYAQLWDERYARLDDVLDDLKRNEQGDGEDDQHP